MDKWKIHTFLQSGGLYGAIAEHTEPGKRFVKNAEGKTPQEAVDKLKAILSRRHNERSGKNADMV